MTEAELAALEALADKAMPGPWRSESESAPDPAWVTCEGSSVAQVFTGEIGRVAQMIPRQVANARFIAAARTAVPELIAEVRELQASLRFFAGLVANTELEDQKP